LWPHNVGLEPINETLAWAVENAIGDDWERAAVHYFRTYEDRWRGWVTPEAYERISEALAEG
jgi:ABC-type proline/glycine betaine transport system substrate-binding protein